MDSRVKVALTSQECEYRVVRHQEFHVPISSPADFAVALNCAPEQICKCVFVKGGADCFALVLCSSNRKLDLKAVSTALECGRCSIAKPEELQALVGYPRNGVSPLGISKYPTLIDENVLKLESILIGAGEVGVEIEIAPVDVVRAANARVGKFCLQQDN